MNSEESITAATQFKSRSIGKGKKSKSSVLYIYSIHKRTCTCLCGYSCMLFTVSGAIVLMVSCGLSTERVAHTRYFVPFSPSVELLAIMRLAATLRLFS